MPGWGVTRGHLPACRCRCRLQVQLINDAYNAVVDAVLGAEAEAAEGTEPCAAILATLEHIRIPIVSLDVPSGAPGLTRLLPSSLAAPPAPLSPRPRRCHPLEGWGHPRGPPRRWLPPRIQAGSGHPREITKCPARDMM